MLGWPHKPHTQAAASCLLNIPCCPVPPKPHLHTLWGVERGGEAAALQALGVHRQRAHRSPLQLQATSGGGGRRGGQIMDGGRVGRMGRRVVIAW